MVIQSSVLPNRNILTASNVKHVMPSGQTEISTMVGSTEFIATSQKRTNERRPFDGIYD